MALISSRLLRLSVYKILASFLLLPLPDKGFLTLSWNANTERDLSGYKVYFGATSRKYDQSVFVGNVTSHRITGLEFGKRYYVAVTAVDYYGNESEFSAEVSAEVGAVSDKTASLATLAYNFPNPFRAGQESTSIRYELQRQDEVTIEIYDLNNQRVKTLIERQLKRAGEHFEDSWDGTNVRGETVAKGVYFCRIGTNKHDRFIKIVVSR